MAVVIYSNKKEVIVFKLGTNGDHIGLEDFFFKDSGRNVEDYDVTVVELPISFDISI